MFSIGFRPVSFRKTFLVILATLELLSASSFADSFLLAVSSTPYDAQMTRIRPVLQRSSQSDSNHPVSLSLVNHWMEDLRGIPYAFSKQWKTPAEVDSGGPADCKGKAVALYERMQAHGANRVRLVIGKRTPVSRVTHAWLTWETSGGTYVLDPTINWAALRTERLGEAAYIPFYAYAGTQRFRAVHTLLLATN